MVLDFPDAPLLDEEWTSPIGTVYRWDGVVWVSVGGGGGTAGTAPPGGGLTVVSHDTTLTGDGTTVSLLSVVPGATSAVTTDATLTGDGTPTAPLAVDILDAGTTFVTAARAAPAAPPRRRR